MERVLLNKITYEFLQSGNANGTTEQEEKLTITVESVLNGIDIDGGFLTLRTPTGWSFDNPNELMDLLQLIEQGVSSKK